MFIDNKYTKTYFRIVNRAKSENRIKTSNFYYELHHINPKSLGGSNQNDNKVLLTFKEHYICHRLLCYMVLEQSHKNKMRYAIYMLCNKNLHQSERKMSFHQKMVCLESNRIASSNREHKPNLGNKHTDEAKRKIGQKSKGRISSSDTISKIKANNQRTNASRGAKNRIKLLGKPKSDEHKRKISESIKKKWEEKRMVVEVGFEPTTFSV